MTEIEAIRKELIGIGNPAPQINARAKALKALRVGQEVFHIHREQFFIVEAGFSETLFVHARHRDEGWQVFLDPTNLIDVGAKKKRSDGQQPANNDALPADKVAALVEASEGLKRDLLHRAEWDDDAKVVCAGTSARLRFTEALAALQETER